MGAWIKMIPDDENAPEDVKAMYDLARTPHGTVDNVMRSQSLRPQSIEGHVTLYRTVLHNPSNTLSNLFLEIVASYTSIINNCAYSVAHHFMNARRLIGEKQRSDQIYASLSIRQPECVFEGKYLALLKYAEKLTEHITKMEEADIQALREAGCDDGEIVEVVQVVAYFNYSNRVLNGLGITTEGDVVGYYKESA